VPKRFNQKLNHDPLNPVSPVINTRRFLKNRVDRWDRWISYSNGVVVVFFLMGVCFFLGAWFTTAFFHLWNSPLAGIVFPQE
jgi:hypothetical protein